MSPLNLLLALTPSLIFGVCAPIQLWLGGDARQRLVGTTVGGFLLTLVVAPFMAVSLSAGQFAIGILTGVILAAGTFYQVNAYRFLGMTRTLPMSSGGQLIGMAAGGVLLFHEWRAPGALPAGAVGIVVIIVGIAAMGWTERDETDRFRPNWRMGGPMLVAGIVCLCAYLLIQQAVGLGGREVMLPQAIGYFVAGFIVTMPRLSPWEGMTDTRFSFETVKQLLIGVMWAGGILVIQLSMAVNGVAVGFTLSQLGIILSTILGIVFLGETRTRKEAWTTALGVALIVGGAVLIGVAKGLDAGAGAVAG